MKFHIMQRLTFLILLAACAIAVSPADAKTKAATSGTAAVAGLWVVGRGRAEREKRRDQLAEGELDLAKSLRKVATERGEAATLKRKLEDELRGLEVKRKDAEVEIALQEKDLELIKAQWEKEKEFAVKQAERERAIATGKLEKEIKEVRSRAAKRLWAAKARYWAMRREFIQRGMEDAQEVAEEIKEAAEKLRIENVKYKAKLDKEIEEVHDELETAMNETLERSLKLLEVQKNKEKEAWMVGFVHKYDAKVNEINNLKAQIRILRQELSDSRDIKLCRERGLAHGDRANEILTWLKTKHGIYADYLFSSIDEYGVFRMGFDLWQEDPAALKKLDKLMPLLRNRLGCPEPPTVAFGNDATCFILTALPRNANVQTGSKLEDIYKKSLPDMELPPGFEGIESSLRERIANELGYQAEQEFMLSYVPPVPLKPRSQSIAQDEIYCFRYFMYYRQEATKGVEPNVTTKNELMQLIYGVSSGYSAYSRKDPVLLETLSQRYDRIMITLGMQAQLAEENKSNEVY